MNRREQNLAWLQERFRPLRSDEDERPVHPVVVGLAVPLDELSDDELEELLQDIKRFPPWVRIHEDEVEDERSA